MNTLILCTRSARFGDFDWHARSLREQASGEALIERHTDPAGLAVRLDAIAASEQPWRVHLLAEAERGRLIVAPGAFLDVGSRTGQVSAGTGDSTLEAWIWNDDGALPEALGDALQARFGIATSIASVSRLKQRLRKTGAVSTAGQQATSPSRFVGAVAVMTSLLTLWFAVYALLSAFLTPWSLSLTDIFDPGASETEELDPDDPRVSRRWRSPASSNGTSRGQSVRYEWEFARRDWRAEWWILDHWLREADAQLEQLGRRPSRARFWEQTYRELARHNDPQLGAVAEAFRAFAGGHGLDHQETATLVLRFVQSIRYKVPRNTLGLLTPPRTLVERYGDCDTKSLLYVLLLRQLGIDATILLSEHYRHAMAGVALPSSGQHLTASGRRYYFTETTDLGFPIGQIPHGMGNLYRWRLVKLDTPIRAFPVPD